MNPKIRTAAVDYLFDAIMELKDKEECYIFFEDICPSNVLPVIIRSGLAE